MLTLRPKLSYCGGGDGELMKMIISMIVCIETRGITLTGLHQQERHRLSGFSVRFPQCADEGYMPQAVHLSWRRKLPLAIPLVQQLYYLSVLPNGSSFCASSAPKLESHLGQFSKFDEGESSNSRVKKGRTV